MIAMAIGSAIYLVAVQAAVNLPRAAFSVCLDQAVIKARAEKIEVAAFGQYARAACSTESSKFSNALISFDVKNKVSRKTATSDADLQIDDYIDGSTRQYRRQMPLSAKPG